MISSQIPVERWYEVIADPTLADAILDRVIHNATRIELSGESLLNQSVENEAVSIDGAPEPMLLSVDRDHDLVEMPLVAELRRAPTDLAGVDPVSLFRQKIAGMAA
jgi:hypothetical protein